MSYEVTTYNRTLEVTANGRTIEVNRGLTSIGVFQNQYFYYASGSSKFRHGIRGGKLVLDKTLTATGFNGTEGIDWENLTESE